MQRHLNLIKTGHQEVEKRVFPRFPFSYLTFRNSGEDAKTYEVKDISYSGMSISLKDGESPYSLGDLIEGEIHWHGNKASITGEVKRIEGQSVGVEFSNTDVNEKNIRELLTVQNIAASMKPIHEYQDDMPTNLAYWLRCDGPFELFVWQHNDHEISKIQIIMMYNYLEWTDGEGIATGKILSVQDHDTPLSNEEEFEFLIDDVLDEEKYNFAQDIITNIKESLLPDDVYNFLKRKLGL